MYRGSCLKKKEFALELLFFAIRTDQNLDFPPHQVNGHCGRTNMFRPKFPIGVSHRLLQNCSAQNIGMR